MYSPENTNNNDKGNEQKDLTDEAVPLTAEYSKKLENKFTGIKKKSKKNEEIMQEIIERDKSKGAHDDVAKLEEALLAIPMDQDEEKFESMLPELNNVSKEQSKEHHWADVDSQELLNVYDSFIEDPNLEKDPNIPASCPPFDPFLDFKSSHNTNKSKETVSKYKSRKNEINDEYNHKNGK